MIEITIGTKVRVKDNAFEGSTDPNDFTFRGMFGKVVWIFGDGAVEVQTDDDEFLPLTLDEIEVIKE